MTILVQVSVRRMEIDQPSRTGVAALSLVLATLDRGKTGSSGYKLYFAGCWEFAVLITNFIFQNAKSDSLFSRFDNMRLQTLFCDYMVYSWVTH
jgi:hypothetical protein